MAEYSLARLSDEELVRDIAALVTRDRVGTALLLAHLAEFDARRLFLSAGFPSMFGYCVDHLHFSESGASKRIQAARAARRFPTLYPALASGRLHLTAVCLLAPHLKDENAKELIEATTYLRRTEIEGLLARRFPNTLPLVDGMAMIRRVAPPAPAQTPPSVPLFEAAVTSTTDEDRTSSVPARHKEHPLEDVNIHEPVGEVHPSPSSERFLIRLTVPRSTHDKLRQAQALLSHTVPARDVAAVLDRALDALIGQLVKRKAGSPAVKPKADAPGRGRGRPEGSGRLSTRARYIAAPIRRAVWERDEGQCTYVSPEGRRCSERQLLEFDHIEPVARGGQASVENTRLRCRAHNQYEAQRVFGAAFMQRKRREALERRLRGAVKRDRTQPP